MAIILPGNVASALPTGYNVANSCRFNNDDSPYLTRNMASQGSSIKGSFSAWVKWSNNNTDKCLMTHYFNNSFFFSIHSQDNNTFAVKDKRSSNILSYETSTIYEDTSSWYNFVVIVDRSLATANDRVKIFINGTQITTSTGLTISQAYDQQTSGSHSGNHSMNNDYTLEVGRNQALNNDGHMDGYIAEMVWLDGVAKSVTDFGEFDADTPTIWKPKDVSDLSSEKGTNGFWLDFEDSSNLGNCAFGGTDFTVNNLAATDQSVDSCTNNFATFNFLDNSNSQYAFSEGNLVGTYSGSNGSGTGTTSTFGVSQGKWYWELKYDSANDSPLRLGITDRVASGTGSTFRTGFGDNDRCYDQGDGKIYTNDIGSSYGSAFSVGDTIGVALDLDNNKIYFRVNGTYQNSGNPAANSNGFSITDPASTANGFYFAVVGLVSGSGVAQVSYNFGSPPYSESGGNSDGNGYGNFAGSVPANYYSLNTKNIAEYG